jgi:hypothetical protein
MLTVGGVATWRFFALAALAIPPGVSLIYFGSHLWIFGTWFLPADIRKTLRRHR